MDLLNQILEYKHFIAQVYCLIYLRSLRCYEITTMYSFVIFLFFGKLAVLPEFTVNNLPDVLKLLRKLLPTIGNYLFVS